MHTFGVGSGASEELIKQCAFKGFGNYTFIYNMDEIEEQVIAALSKTKLNYKLLHKMALYDANGNEIAAGTQANEAKPLVEGNPAEMCCLLPHGVQAVSYRVEILEPNSMSVESFEGNIS